MPGNFYTDMDERCAAARLRRSICLLAAIEAPLAAIYVIAALNALRWLMLAALVLSFAIAVFCGDLWVMPALRYARFLKEMKTGLRRSVECVLKSMEANVQLQDGVCVYALHVQLCGNGDSRIFYINASKAECAPGMGSRVRLVSYGRHVLGFEIC